MKDPLSAQVGQIVRTYQMFRMMMRHPKLVDEMRLIFLRALVDCGVVTEDELDTRTNAILLELGHPRSTTHRKGIRDALIDAHRRGVHVRVVMESSNRDRDVPQELIDAGISVLGDRREGLMHDKFVIIDRSEVWLGSMNFTIGGGYKDNNNLLRIRSQKLVENYQTEFDEMFVDDHFGPDTVSDTPNPVTSVDGTKIETYFSPDDGVADVIVDLLSDAQESIYFMAYSFTSDPISEAIQARAADGVTVAGVMDYSQVKSNQGGEYDTFAQAGYDVRTDGIDGLMHHKVFIIDEQIVITGSYNFSRSAEERNDENILVIYNTDIAQEFLKEFERVQAQADIE